MDIHFQCQSEFFFANFPKWSLVVAVKTFTCTKLHRLRIHKNIVNFVTNAYIDLLDGITRFRIQEYIKEAFHLLKKLSSPSHFSEWKMSPKHDKLYFWRLQSTLLVPKLSYSQNFLNAHQLSYYSISSVIYLHYVILFIAI